MPLDGHEPSDQPGPNCRVLGDLTLNDIVEIRVRVNEKLETGLIPTTLVLLNSEGNIFEVVLFSGSELQTYSGGGVCRGSNTFPMLFDDGHNLRQIATSQPPGLRPGFYQKLVFSHSLGGNASFPICQACDAVAPGRLLDFASSLPAAYRVKDTYTERILNPKMSDHIGSGERSRLLVVTRGIASGGRLGRRLMDRRPIGHLTENGAL